MRPGANYQVLRHRARRKSRAAAVTFSRCGDSDEPDVGGEASSSTGGKSVTAAVPTRKGTIPRKYRVSCHGIFTWGADDCLKRRKYFKDTLVTVDNDYTSSTKNYR